MKHAFDTSHLPGTEFWDGTRDKPIISPSLLSADFSALGEEARRVRSAPWLHFDVMDGHFVPNLTFGAPVIKALRSHSNAFFDVHIMAKNQEHVLNPVLAAGVDSVTIHGEEDPHVYRTLQSIRAHGARAGIALCPGTPAIMVKELLPVVDLILVMTVNPGFGGQAFLAPQLDKIAELRSMIDESGYPILLSIDGGVKENNAHQVLSRGADVLVAGSAIFQSDDAVGVIERLGNTRV